MPSHDASASCHQNTVPTRPSSDLTTTASNGSHTLTAVARDAAGNQKTSTAVTVTVSNTTPDTTPPTVSITSPAIGTTHAATITASPTASDTAAVTRIQFQLAAATL